MNPLFMSEDQRARLQLAHSWIKEDDEESRLHLRSYLEDGGEPNACLSVAVTNFSLECTRILLEFGANPNYVARHASPALNVVSKKSGHIDLFMLLLNAGADIDVKFVDGNTPLLCAVKNNDREKVRILIERGCNIFAKNNGGVAALHLAAIGGYSRILSMLLEAGVPVDVKQEGPRNVNNTGMQALHFTAYGLRGGHVFAAEVLLDAGADPDSAMSNGRTTLHLAAHHNAHKVASVLLTRGCNVNPISNENNEHKTPLMHAIDQNSIDMVKLLVSAGADLTIGDQWGSSPLSVAIFSQKLEICTILLHAGADVNQASLNGLQPFDFAVKHPLLTEIMILAGCHIPTDLRVKVVGDERYQGLADSPDFLEKLVKFAENPCPMALCCRSVIRRILGKLPSSKIDQLPIAQPLKDFLSFKDIDKLVQLQLQQ